MFISLAVLLLLIVIVIFYTRQPKFGRRPYGEHRLKRINDSTNAEKGKFKNQSYTPDFAEGHSIWSVTKDFFFTKHPRKKPLSKIPSQKTDLKSLSTHEDVLIWFGHSSYFIQLDGIKFLVDPVLSGNASPIPGSNKAFNGTDIYTADDIPEIDILFITHDHYDHADYETLTKIKSKVKRIVCGLGVGAHLERWNYAHDIIIEKDWNENAELYNGFIVHALPARHFSGREFSRNNTLWLSFLLETPSMKIYIGGDSGYDSHFTEIGKKFGSIDLVILDNGQYDLAWKYIHMLPDEVVKAAKDLNAKKVLPLHSGKFAMANHPWDEPLIRVSKAAIAAGIPLLTPMIGEKIYLKQEQTFTEWWKGVDN